MARFEYTLTGAPLSVLMPRLTMVLSHKERFIEVDGVVDTGSTINVLPYDYGDALGLVWDEHRIKLTLTGALADYDARAAFVMAANAQLTGETPVRLAVAWTAKNDAPLVFGQTNFLMEFNVCFYRSQEFFEVWRN